jgi:hypothetical protein
MEGSLDHDKNEEGGYKSEDLPQGEIPASEVGESDEKLKNIASIKMFPSQKDKFHLSVREEIPAPHVSDIKETEEQTTVQMNVKETAFEKYDPYVFTVTLTLVYAWQLDSTMLQLSYK